MFLTSEKNISDVTHASLIQLEQELEKTPYKFYICNELIQGYIWLKDSVAVEKFREHAAAHCPTTEEFWLSWIIEVKEKLANATKPGEEVPLEFRIKQLYHASLTLCPTADLWVSYLKFLKHRSLSSTNLGIRSQIIHASYIRRMCECAVRDFGLHGTEGPKIWSVYRHFEQLILQKILELANCGESTNGQDRKDVQTVAPNLLAERDPFKMAKQQTERVRSLFCRQMQLPLSGLQDLWDEYRIFEAELPSALAGSTEVTNHAAKLHEEGLVEWELRKTMELQVMMSDDDKIETIQRLSSGWTNYINVEKRCKSPNRNAHVCTLYLRACEDLGHLRADLWFAWFHWVITELHDSNLASIILERAVRYHPLETRLWTAYIGCERLRKPFNVTRTLKVFTKALKYVNVYRSPKDVVTLAKTCADCIIHGFYLRHSPIKSVTNTYNQDLILCPVDMKDVQCPDSLYNSVSELLGFNSEDPNTPLVSLNHRIEEVFSLAQAAIIHTIEHPESANNPHKSTDSAARQVHEELLFNSLRHLWKEWLRICTTAVTDFHHSENVSALVLLCTTRNKLEKFQFWNLHKPVEWEKVLKEIPHTEIHNKPSDWTAVAEAFTFSWASVKSPPPLTVLWGVARIVVHPFSELFLHRWFQLSLLADCPDITIDVSSLLEKSQQESPTSFSCDSPYSLLTESASMWPELKDTVCESHSSFLSETDTSVMQVTLNELKSRREKRRRRFSECDSETCLSDTSSDSSSVSSAFHETSSSMVLRKRLRSLSRHPSSKQNMSNSSSFHDCATRNTFNPNDSVELIERATQCTWSGHECDGDPSLTPPVPPITSAMSPLRKQQSLSFASTSPRSFSSDTSLMQAQRVPKACFVSEPQHQAELPENIQNSLDIEGSVENADSKKRKLLINKRKTNKSVQSNVVASTNRKKNTKPCESSFQRAKTKLLKNHSSLEQGRKNVVEKPEERFKEDEADIDMKNAIDDETDDATCGHLPDGIKDTPICVQSGRHHQLLSLHRPDSTSESQNFSATVINLMGCKKEDCTLFVSNLDRSVTLNDVKTLFHDALGLVEIRMVCNRNNVFKGFCYIDFESPDLAQQAVQKYQSLQLNGRRVKVHLSNPKAPIYEETTLFFTLDCPSLCDFQQNDISNEISNILISETHQNLGATIKPLAVRPLVDLQTQKLKSYGYIDFSCDKDARKVLSTFLNKNLPLETRPGSFSLHPSIPMKRHKPILAPPVKKSAEKKLSTNDELVFEPCTLFVNNLSFTVTEEMLQKHFEQYGNVSNVTICRDQTNQKSKGYGFVTLMSEKDAFSCRMLNNSYLDGREISVSVSHRKPTLPKTTKETVQIRRKDASRIHQRIQISNASQRPTQAFAEQITEPASSLTNKDFKKFLLASL